MQNTGGSAAVTKDDAPTPRVAFLESQLAIARTNAGAAAATLAVACRGASPPDIERLDELTDAACSAAAELRMAIQALRLAR